MKKGDVNSSTVGLIILVVLLFTLVFFVIETHKVHREKSQKQICKESIRSEATTQISAERIPEIFGSGDRESGARCPIFYEEIRTNDEREIKKKVARHMYDSWDMFHMGRLNLFDTRGEETYCIMSHHIEFKGGAQTVGEVEGFIDYLSTENIPDLVHEDTTYIEYLHCFNTDNDAVELEEIPSALNVIDTREDYGIMFIYSKRGYMHKITGAISGLIYGTSIAGGLATIGVIALGTTLSGGALLIVGGGALGAAGGYGLGEDKHADWSACVVLFPYSEEILSQFECTYMPGEQETR